MSHDGDCFSVSRKLLIKYQYHHYASVQSYVKNKQFYMELVGFKETSLTFKVADEL